MSILFPLALSLTHPPVWCPPPRPIIVYYPPPIVFWDCAPTAPVRPAVPETKPAVKPDVKPETKPETKPTPKVELKPEAKPEVKQVGEVAPVVPNPLPKFEGLPMEPKPAPKMDVDIKPVPKSNTPESIIPKPVDLPTIPPTGNGVPKLPEIVPTPLPSPSGPSTLPPIPDVSKSNYRPGTVDVVHFPGSTESTNVSLYNLSTSAITMTVSGTEIKLPARSVQTVRVTGEVWWQRPDDAKRSSDRGGLVEVYLK